MADADNENSSFPTIQDLKKKPVFQEITSESGHPQITIENLSGKIEDMGYEVSYEGPYITNDDVADGVKDFRENLEAERLEKYYRPKAKEFKKYAWIGLAASIIFAIITLWANFNSVLIFLTVILTGATIILFLLAKPQDRFDRIWIKASAKIYSGTKTREMRESGVHKAGTTKIASSVYVHSEIKFSISADSRIGVDRVREDVNTISKYLQKI